MTYQNCSHCGKLKPCTPEFFHFKNIEDQTYHDECKVCRTQKDEDFEHREDQYLTRRMEMLESERLKLANDKWLLVKAGMWELGLDRLDKAISQYSQGACIPHAAELVEAMNLVFGGPIGIACQMANVFYDPSTKQSDRIRILEMMNRAILKNTEMGGAKKPYELLSDDDLKKELKLLTLEDKVA